MQKVWALDAASAQTSVKTQERQVQTPRHPPPATPIIVTSSTNSSTLRQPFVAYIPFSWMDASRPEETATLPLEDHAAAKGDLPGNDDDEQRRVENARLAVVPPYWQHRRYESYTSANIVRPPAIILEDHTEDLETNCQTPLWAKEVSLQDYVVVSGNNIPSVGDYVVWTCTIKTLDVGPSSSSTLFNFSSLAEFLLHASLQGGSITIRKRSIFYRALKSQAQILCPSAESSPRYSEFEELRRQLLITFPNAGAAMPPLPPKSIFRKKDQYY